MQRVLGYHIVVDDADELDPLPIFDAKDGAQLEEPEYYIDEGVKVVEEDEDSDWVAIVHPSSFDQVEAVWTHARSLSQQPQPSDEHAGQDVESRLSPGRLYAGRRARPKMGDVHQGNLADCFFLASLAAIVATQKGWQIIKKIIKSRGDGTYESAFFGISDDNEIEQGRESVGVDKRFPTRGDHEATFLYSSPDRQIQDAEVPLWVALLEKAYAAWSEVDDPLDKEEVAGYQDLEEGTASRAIAHLIGVEPEHIQWDTKSKSYLKDVAWSGATFESEEAEDEAERLEEPIGPDNIDAVSLLRAIGLAKADPSTFVVAESLTVTGDDEKYLDEDLKIKDTHVYVVLSTNRRERTVRLWDPAHDHPGSIPIVDFRRLFNRVLKASTAESPLSK